MKQPKPQTKLVSVRMRVSQHDQLKNMAGLTGVKVNRLINQAIENSINTMIEREKQCH